MKIYKRVGLYIFIHLLILTLILPAATVTASQSNNADTGEIEVILNIDDQLMAKYIEEFNKKYPGVTVKYTKYSEYESDIMKRLASGNYGDVLFIPASIDSQGVQTYLEPLGKVKDYTDNYNFIENAYILDDILYSIPSSAYLKGIIYNKEVFDKAGITRQPTSEEEFLDALQMIKDRTDALPFYTNYEMEWILNDWSFFPYIEKSGDANYRGQKFVYEKDPFKSGSNFYEVYKLLYDIADRGLCEDKPSVADFSELCKKMNNGEIGATAVGTWSYDLMKYAGSNTESMAFMPYPNQVNGKQYATIGIDYGYSISKNSRHKDIARKFIDFMINESGYAVENDRISIVKSDPLPDIYSNVKNLELKISNAYPQTAYNYYTILAANGDPESSEKIRQVIDEARKPDGSFDALMKSWNDAWEGARPHRMEAFSYEDLMQNSEVLEKISWDNPQSYVMDNRAIEYSTTEKEYIADKKSIKVGYLTNMAPFQYMKKDTYGNGQFCGLARDICDSIKDSTKMEFEYIPFENYQNMTDALAAGDIDLAAGMRVEDENAEDLLFSKSYFELSNVIIKADTLEFSELSNNKTEAYVKDSEITSNLVFDSNKKAYDSVADEIKAIEQKEADFAICNYYSAYYYIKEGKYSYVAVVPLTEKDNLCLAFSKNVDTRLVSICNKCVYSFPEESIQMKVMQYMDTPAESITLERYIDENPVQSMMIVLGFVLIVAIILFIVGKEKYKNKKRHEMDLKRYAVLSQLTDEYVFEYDLKNERLHFDKKFSNKFGFEQNVEMSDNHIDNEALKEFITDIQKAKETNESLGEAFQVTEANNEKQWYRRMSYCIMDEKQIPLHIIGKYINVQGFITEKEEITKKANHDFLTSLYNRTGFERAVSELSKRYELSDSFIFAVIDLDNFKSVNDSLGHLGGDRALQKLGSELTAICADNILCARYGGDEFVVCMFDVSKESAEKIFAALVAKMNCDIEFEGKHHTLSISLGAAHFNSLISPDEMFEEADKVLYSVKHLGKNNYKIQESDEII